MRIIIIIAVITIRRKANIERRLVSQPTHFNGSVVEGKLRLNCKANIKAMNWEAL